MKKRQKERNLSVLGRGGKKELEKEKSQWTFCDREELWGWGLSRGQQGCQPDCVTSVKVGQRKERQRERKPKERKRQMDGCESENE